MFIIDAVPLTKIPLTLNQTFSYFSKEKLEQGSLVVAPIGKRKTTALVIGCAPLSEMKIQLKQSSFKLKGIDYILCQSPIVNQKQIVLGFWVHRYYLCPLGLAFKLLLPQNLLKRKKPFTINGNKKNSQNKKEGKQPLFLCMGKAQRQKEYKKEIKKTIKEKKQVLFLAPEKGSLKEISSLIKSAFPKANTIISHGDLKPSQELENWQKTKDGTIDIIIGTRSAVFLPFSKLGLVIIDEYENNSYKSWQQHPKYDARTVAKKLSEGTGACLILADNLPSAISFFEIEQKNWRLKKSAAFPAKPDIEIVDMKEELKKKNFSIFNEKLKRLIIEEQRKGGKTILFINRRGLATALICRDCGFVFKCEKCEAPMVFHKNEKSTMLCHHCGNKRLPPALCPKCQSWKIKPIGAGTQKVAAELEKLAPKIKVLRLDSDIAKTEKQQKEILDNFLQKENDVLVGTQLILNMLKENKKKDFLTAAILVDHLLSLPEYKAEERVFNILWRLKELSKKMIIQTYNPEAPVLKYIAENELEEFLSQELQNREDFQYPPFSHLLKLTYINRDFLGSKTEAENFKNLLESSFSETKISALILGPAPGFIPKTNGKYVFHILIKIKKEPPSASVKAKEIILQNIRPQWDIDVDPESLI